MATYIKNADLFGRVGSGIGQGLAQQLPEEITRGRLAAGLQNLEGQQGLTPFQQFSRLAATPGITPQMLQSGSELLRQQQYLDALKQQYGQGQENQGYKPSQEEMNAPVAGEVPSLATAEATAQSYKNIIPPSEQQERINAQENFNKYPARYKHDFENALAEQKAITKRNKEIQEELRQQEKIAVDKETQVKKALDDEIKKLGTLAIPPKVKQNFEKKVINAVLSKKDGGEGLTQEQAIQKYSDQLRQANRDYLTLGSLSTWSPVDFNRQTSALQKDFASRGEQQQMMDKLIADYEISPQFAAHKAYPTNPKEVKTLNEIYPSNFNRTRQFKSDELAKMKRDMGKTGSPLSIAYDIERKGQDPRQWLEYLSDNKDDLEVWQAEQLTKNLNLINLKDLWLRVWEK